LVLIAAAIVLYSIAQQPQRRAFINGQILTMDASNSIQEALLIDEGKIIAAGSNAKIQAMIDNSTEVTDLGGKTLMPGIIDAHGHFPFSGIGEMTADLNSPPIGTTRRISDIQKALNAQAQKQSEGWLMGMGYDDTLLEEKRHPSREDLDSVSKTRPIVIMHVSGHMAVVNSAALAALNINAETPDPEGGVIVKDEQGQPTGLLLENAMHEIRTQAMDISALDFLKVLRSANDEYLSVGVTTAQAGAVDRKVLDGLTKAEQFGFVDLRQVLFPLVDDKGPQWVLDAKNFKQNNNDKLLVGPVKMIADGSIQGFTGFLGQPYHTPHEGNAEYRGFPTIMQEELDANVLALHEAGLQMAIHGNGDAAIDAIISAFEKAQTAHPAEDPRLIIIHAQMLREDQITKMKKLGISPSFFSAHTYYWGDRHREIFMGPERAARMSPAKSAIDAELKFSIHLDTPVVPMQPMLLVWSAVNRFSSSGEIIGEEQRIPPMAALRAVTIDAAWQIRQEDNRGSLEAGKWADLIILSDSPLRNYPGIKDIKVLETVIAGKTVFER
jgi:predicted amidohydrolase YtcJ